MVNLVALQRRAEHPDRVRLPKDRFQGHRTCMRGPIRGVNPRLCSGRERLSDRGALAHPLPGATAQPQRAAAAVFSSRDEGTPTAHSIMAECEVVAYWI